MQIEGAELTESGQRARSNRNFPLRVDLRRSPTRRLNDRYLRTAVVHCVVFAWLSPKAPTVVGS